MVGTLHDKVPDRACDAPRRGANYDQINIVDHGLCDCLQHGRGHDLSQISTINMNENSCGTDTDEIERTPNSSMSKAY